MDIAEFLTAQYDEEQRLADAASATGIHWCATVAATAYGARMVIESDDDFGVLAETSVPTNPKAVANAEHIAAHDPARVLADIAAKRAVVEDYRIVLARHAAEKIGGDEVMAAAYDLVVKSLRMVLRLLAAPYADHPDYDPAWRIDG